MFMRIVKISMNALTILGLGYMLYNIILEFISWHCGCNVGGLLPAKCMIDDIDTYIYLVLLSSIAAIMLFKDLFRLHSFFKHVLISTIAATVFYSYFQLLSSCFLS